MKLTNLSYGFIVSALILKIFLSDASDDGSSDASDDGSLGEFLEKSNEFRLPEEEKNKHVFKDEGKTIIDVKDSVLAGKNIQRAKKRINVSSVDAPSIPSSDSSERWYRKPHPYYVHIQEECESEIKLLCDETDDFFLTMSCLEKLAVSESSKERKRVRNRRQMSGDQISDTCKSVILSGSGSDPNPLIFEEHTRSSIDISSLDLGVDVLEQIYGFVKAPLLYSDPQSTSLIRAWFQIVPCAVQPAPKGVIYHHLGGPLPGISNIPLVLYDQEDWRYILKNYDLVISDQRGMGLSALDYLLPWAIPKIPTNPEFFAQFAVGFGSFTGNLFTVTSSFGDYPAPCYDLKTEDKVPTDLTNTQDVTEFLRKKASLISACSEYFEKDDGNGGSYNILQFMGTQGHIHDIEWLRWALGSPKISISGFSYGTRVAAAYAGQFPSRIRRMSVSGVMGPIPDTLDYAAEAARNTAEIFGFVQSQCNAAGEVCTKNPMDPSDSSLYEPGFYFDGDINEAVTELFSRSRSDFYESNCGGVKLPTHQLTTYLALRTTSMVLKQGQFQDKSWPIAMLEIPTSIFLILQNPCTFAQFFGWDEFIVDSIDTFNLIPALDMAGRWSADQVSKFITDFAKDIAMSPSLSMFSLYATNAHGWPQLPAPITFSNPDVEVVIAQALYDQRTGMNMAQQFQLNFPRSNMVVAPVAGHCVGNTHGAEANKLMNNFLLYGAEPPNGYMTDMPPKKMDFALGTGLLSQCVDAPVEACFI